jgi:hypothetical protein
MDNADIKPVNRRKTLLKLRCRNKGHLVVKVVDSDDSDVLTIEAARYCAGRDRETWTPASFSLIKGSGHRYGCACGMSNLIRDDGLAAAVARGVRRQLLC